MGTVPPLELSSHGIGFYKQIGNSVLVLLPPNVPGIKGSGTLDEMYSVVCGGNYLPGLVYKESYHPLTIPCRMGIAAMEALIPEDKQDFTRYLDLRNGGVLRWNHGYNDDYVTSTPIELNGKPHLRCCGSGRPIDIDLANETLIVKIMRENTGLMALDDIDFIGLLMTMGLCVTWMGGKLFQSGGFLLQQAFIRSGLTGPVIELAKQWDALPKDLIGRCWFPNEKFVFSFQANDFAESVGLRLEGQRRNYFRPAVRPLTKRHWCSKGVQRLEMFKDLEHPPYVDQHLVARVLDFHEMINLAEIRNKILSAIGIERKVVVDDFVIADYVRSKIPIQ